MDWLNNKTYASFYEQYKHLSGIDASMFHLTGLNEDQFTALKEDGEISGTLLVKVWSTSRPKILWIYAELSDSRLVFFPVHHTHNNDYSRTFARGSLLSEFTASFKKSKKGKYWCCGVSLKTDIEEEPDWSQETSQRVYVINGKEYVKGYFGQLYCPEDVRQRQEDLMNFTIDFFEKINSGYYQRNRKDDPNFHDIVEEWKEPFRQAMKEQNERTRKRVEELAKEEALLPEGTPKTISEILAITQREEIIKALRRKLNWSDGSGDFLDEDEES